MRNCTNFFRENHENEVESSEAKNCQPLFT